jgi:hypothetical protein
MQVAYAPDPRSTRLDVPTGSEGGVARARLAGAITLVDHSLRSQWSLAACTDSSAEELGEALPT